MRALDLARKCLKTGHRRLPGTDGDILGILRHAAARAIGWRCSPKRPSVNDLRLMSPVATSPGQGYIPGFPGPLLPAPVFLLTA